MIFIIVITDPREQPQLHYIYSSRVPAIHQTSNSIQFKIHSYHSTQSIGIPSRKLLLAPGLCFLPLAT
jgi:hypothetical protein